MEEANLHGSGPMALKTNTNATSYSDEQPDDFQRKSITSYSEGTDEDYKDAELPMRLTEDEIVASLPPWTTQITLRACLVGVVLGVLFQFVTMRFALGPGGVVPTFNMPMGLTAFLVLKPLTTWLLRAGWTTQPFTAQENTVVQTFAMAMVTSLWILGFGSYLQAMDQQTYENIGGASTPGNYEADVSNPTTARIISYGMCIVFIGVFVNLTVRRALVIDYNLPYPTGTAVGTMIRSFFNDGRSARRQALMLAKTGLAAFAWDFWTWFFNGNCPPAVAATAEYISSSVNQMPNLGPHAYIKGWHFDFTVAYVGAGFITPLSVNYSMMVGAILSWGIAWPLVRNRAGDWYPILPATTASYSFQGFAAYPIFWSLGLYLGDGGYQMLKMFVISFTHWQMQRHGAGIGEPTTANAKVDDDPLCLGIHARETPEERSLRKRVFVRDDLPWYVAFIGWACCLIIGTVAIPHIYTAVKWYYLVVVFLIVPFFSLANSYAAGLTDQDNSSIYGKLAILIFSAWAGTSGGGVIAGLGICGVVVAATSQAAVLMQDFRTGYYTLTSPRSLVAAQLVGAFIGVLFAPGVYAFYTHSFNVGVDYEYSVPYAKVYRAMAVIAAEGVNHLPKYCLAIAGVLMGAAVLVNLLKDFVVPRPYKKFVPLPSAVSIPFFIGAPIAIDFCLGGAIMLAWRIVNPTTAQLLGIPAGAGLMVGDGLWQLPLGILGVTKVVRPVCVAYFRGQRDGTVLNG